MLISRTSSTTLIVIALICCGCRGRAGKKTTDAGVAPPTVVVAAAPDASAPIVPTEPLKAARPDAREGSALLLAGEHVFVADEDANAVVSLSTTTAKQTMTKLAGRPAQMLVTKEGELAVALRDEHAIAFYGVTADGSLIERRRAPVLDEPVALARVPSSTNDTLVSVSAIGHAVCLVPTALDTPKDAKPRCFDSLARDPRAVTTSDDGKTAIVSHASADGASIVSIETGEVRVVNLGHPRFEKKLGDPMRGTAPVFEMGEVRLARFARQAFAAIRIPGEKERFAIPHALVAPGDKESVGNGYGSGSGSGSTFTFDETMTIFPTVEMDVSPLVVGAGGIDIEVKNQGLLLPEVTDHEARCFLPRGAVAADAALYVACVGSSDVHRYDIETSKKMKITRVTQPPARFVVKGGPTAVALDEKGTTLYVFSQQDRTLSVFEEPAKVKASAEVKAAARVITLEDGNTVSSMSDQVKRGRALFHASRDERMTKDRRACATCHPDGRDDGLVWTSPEGFRQTIFLAGRLDRGKAPFGWHGKHATITEHLKVTVKNLGGTGLPADAIADLDAYIRALPTPPRAKRELSADAQEGKRIFTSSETRCSTCHAESQGFGGVKAENVSSGTMTDTVKEFLVPSLRFVGASAPYYHDGRFPTLDALIVAADGKMGHTKHLSAADVTALSAFLQTL